MNAANLVLALVPAGIALAAPLLYAALGELVSEKAGVINIHLEGMMLCGALFGVVGSAASGNVGIGFLTAALGGIGLAVIHGVLCFVLGANQVVSGVVLNILALGGTSFLFASVFSGALSAPAPTLAPLPIPVLSQIPIVGKMLFAQNVTVYAAYLLVLVLWWVWRRSTLGIILEAAGERPTAAASLGISVPAVRWSALLVCGALAGIGGGQLVLAGLGLFSDNMTAGRGFIALAAVVFGRWRPVGTLGAVLLFAFADALQVRAQVLEVPLPYDLLVALPYIVTVVALALFVRRMRPPATLGINYRRA
jgi:simple sugar transport system permease protein